MISMQIAAECIRNFHQPMKKMESGLMACRRMGVRALVGRGSGTASSAFDGHDVKRQPCNRCCFAPMVGLVISRKLWLPILTSAAIALVISGCSFAEDNVGSVNEPAAPEHTPQVPESMKTGSVTGETQYPPQGL